MPRVSPPLLTWARGPESSLLQKASLLPQKTVENSAGLGFLPCFTRAAEDTGLLGHLLLTTLTARSSCWRPFSFPHKAQGPCGVTQLCAPHTRGLCHSTGNTMGDRGLQTGLPTLCPLGGVTSVLLRSKQICLLCRGHVISLRQGLSMFRQI